MLEWIIQVPALLVGFVLLAILWYNIQRKQYASLPPGPPPKPIFGNISQIGHSEIHEGKLRYRSFANLVDKYGSNGMGTIHFFNQPCVFVTEFQTVKKILNEDALTRRAPSVTRDEFFQGKGLIFTEGELWKEQRRFALGTLRDFGMGKTWLQDIIIEEAQELVEDIRKTKSSPVNPDSLLSPSIANVICAISYGQRFKHTDEKFRRLAGLMGQNTKILAKNLLVDFFPFLKSLPFSGFRSRHLAWIQNANELSDFLRPLVNEHKGSLHDGEAQDYIHAYMLEAEKQKNKHDTTFTDVQLKHSILNLFGAGSETTYTTLAWAFLYLLENPEVYEKIQKEVDGVVQDGSYPTLEDKDRLPYTQAAIFEVQRMANLVPIVGRRALQDTQLDGYMIPAGVNVFVLLSAVHEDPKYFPEPLSFKPERFLDESGNLLAKVEGFVPFSVGKRFCLGQPLAQMELYIFLVTIIKYFHIRLPAGQMISTTDSLMGIVNSPMPHKVIFEPR